MNGRVLVAGVGNVFFGDDAFGVEVVRSMMGVQCPPGVSVCDFGIRGLHLAYEVLDRVELLVVADAIARGDAPGTLTLLEPDVDSPMLVSTDAHAMNLPAVFAAVGTLGGTLPRVLLVGCEPATVGDGIGLSPPVAAAVPSAAAMIRDVVFDVAGIELPVPEA